MADGIFFVRRLWCGGHLARAAVGRLSEIERKCEMGAPSRRRAYSRSTTGVNRIFIFVHGDGGSRAEDLREWAAVPEVANYTPKGCGRRVSPKNRILRLAAVFNVCKPLSHRVLQDVIGLNVGSANRSPLMRYVRLGGYNVVADVERLDLASSFHLGRNL